MAATGAAACVATLWGAHTYVQHENSKQTEAELRQLQAQVADIEEKNAAMDYQVALTKQTLNTTAQLKNALENKLERKQTVIVKQDQQVAELQTSCRKA